MKFAATVLCAIILLWPMTVLIFMNSAALTRRVWITTPFRDAHADEKNPNPDVLQEQEAITKMQISIRHILHEIPKRSAEKQQHLFYNSREEYKVNAPGQ